MKRSTWMGILALAVSAFVSQHAEAKPRAARRRPPIVFWIANANVAASRAEAVRKCAEHVDERSCRKLVFPVRGPYVRKHKGSDPEDDPRVYVYRGADGQWYDRDGNFPGCDPSGCP